VELLHRWSHVELMNGVADRALVEDELGHDTNAATEGDE
jgi:hypothetical protein